MRTLVVLAIGLALLAAVLYLVRLLGGDPRQMRLAALAFVAAWFVFNLFSLRGGLRAGFGLGLELAIHSLLFGVPALAAYLAVRFLVGGR